MRRICLGVAAATGLGAALLLGGGPTAHYEGLTQTCGTPIVDAYDPAGAVRADAAPPPRSDGTAYADWRLARSCDQQEERWALLGGLGALVSLVAFTGAQVAREEQAGDERAEEPALAR
ncbi:hypothetical protein H5V45_08995 [Nocardioides sp. KIGAM211]|uniref:Uncharacterized protein n=1 Tax=Nocardioides luti TaxID=2761101 RepID=A0A7X0RFQ5_9ACTN|nr:hypothetical protein [Nocardioides luti]MBB6627457.1 hypothetical protein [Nocardioides luti]